MNYADNIYVDAFNGWFNTSWKNIQFDETVLVRRLKETAYLNGGLRIVYKNEHTNTKEEFYFEGGIADYVSYLGKSRTGVYPSVPFFFDNKSGKVNVQVAFQYGEEDEESIYAYANNIYTADGGTHLSGFKTSITRIVNQFAKSSGVLKEKDANLSGEDIREGIIAVVSVRLPQPQFEGQTKGKLGSQEVEGVVNRLFSEAVTEYFEKNPLIVKTIAERALRSAKARAAAKRASETIKRQSFLGRTGSLPGKLSDCNSEDNVNTELFIVEGDSAAGSSKFGRDPEFQAVMPIRGKIINPEKNDYARLIQNEEVSSIISALGTGIRDEFKIEDLRYGKIVIMTDADDDGAHIAALLMTFFYRFMRPLVTSGKLYLAKPPLYRVNVKNQKYFYSIQLFNSQGIKSAYATSKNAIPFNTKPKTASLENKVFNNVGEYNFVRSTYSSLGSKDLDGKIVNYNWYVNDSLVNSTDSILIYYYNQGTNDIKLVITDNDGAKDSTTTKVILNTFVKTFKGGLLGGVTALNQNKIYTADSTFDPVNGASIIMLDRLGNTIYPLVVSSKIFTTPSVSSDSSVFITSGSSLNGFSKTGAPLWSTIPLGGNSFVTPIQLVVSWMRISTYSRRLPR
jgi:DNA gyrase/topoisomerase IV subunit B